MWPSRKVSRIRAHMVPLLMGSNAAGYRGTTYRGLPGNAQGRPLPPTLSFLLIWPRYCASKAGLDGRKPGDIQQRVLMNR